MFLLCLSVCAGGEAGMSPEFWLQAAVSRQTLPSLIPSWKWIISCDRCPFHVCLTCTQRWHVVKCWSVRCSSCTPPSPATTAHVPPPLCAASLQSKHTWLVNMPYCICNINALSLWVFPQSSVCHPHSPSLSIYWPLQVRPAAWRLLDWIVDGKMHVYRVTISSLHTQKQGPSGSGPPPAPRRSPKLVWACQRLLLLEHNMSSFTILSRDTQEV